MKVKISDIEIDHLRLEDVDPILSYWHDTPRDFWIKRGVKAKLPMTRKEDEERILQQVANPPKSLCIVVCQGHRMGMHTLTHREEKHAIMHAHFWSANFRGMGVGPISYVKAMDWFIRENDYDKIIFQTPKSNPSPNRVKEKLGIPIIKEVMFDGPILEKPLPAWHSEVCKTDIPGLYSRLREMYGSETQE